MLNLRNQSGRRIEVLLDKDVASGSITESYGVVGVPVDHALNGNTVTFVESGLVNLTYDGQGTIGVGTYLYWDVSAAALTITPACGDIEVGQVEMADPDGGANVYTVRLHVGYPRAIAGCDQTSQAE